MEGRHAGECGFLGAHRAGRGLADIFLHPMLQGLVFQLSSFNYQTGRIVIQRHKLAKLPERRFRLEALDGSVLTEFNQRKEFGVLCFGKKFLPLAEVPYSFLDCGLDSVPGKPSQLP